MKKFLNKELVKIIVQFLIAFLTALGVAGCTKSLTTRQGGDRTFWVAMTPNPLQLCNSQGTLH